MAFNNAGRFQPFEQKVWLSSPTMHGEEMEYMKKAFWKKDTAIESEEE